MRIVGTEVAGLDSRGEVVAEGGRCFGDLLDGLLDALGDGAAGAFGICHNGAQSYYSARGFRGSLKV